MATAALPCLTCDSDQSGLIAHGRAPSQIGQWKYRARSIADSTSIDGTVFQTAHFANGDDSSRLSFNVERNYHRKRKQVELASRVAPLRAAGYIAKLIYDAHPAEDEQLLLSLSGGKQRPAAASIFRHAKPSMTDVLRMNASWIHDRHWRASVGYTIDETESHRDGLGRSVQLANGSLPSAQMVTASFDYSPNFGDDTSLRFGVEARSDRISGADAAALAMNGRTAQRLSLKAAVGF